ncbi:MAG: hypothetical protein P8Y95_13360 [Gammaproteobacteria bacterium]|jgi:hypothetical protein
MRKELGIDGLLPTGTIGVATGEQIHEPERRQYGEQPQGSQEVKFAE